MEMRLDLEHTGVLTFDLERGEADERHTHNHYQISVPLSGDLLTFHNDQPTKIKDEEVLLVPPGDIHQHEAAEGRKRIMLISFNETMLEKAYQSYTGSRPEIIDFSPVQPGSPSLLKKARSLFQTASFDGVEAAMKLEEELTGVILDQMKGSHTEEWQKAKERQLIPEPLIKAARDYIQTFYDEDMDLERLASQLNVSKYHLHRSFSKQVGKTPREFLHFVRLEKAGLLLKKGHRDITHVAYSVGYQSISTFNRAFKARYGQTPTQFVKDRCI
ncbi:helix-turn-helix domain-containing protein [Halobacillus litoralis]|uniref:helix-turn-helix domain-containing protein n=1 Tax=Halobacillus litoralis TaxID=45668 RepID=UPI001CFD8571|nr:helix-turn-helix domain-containing protein [Halobacillus litoralis]